MRESVLAALRYSRTLITSKISKFSPTVPPQIPHAKTGTHIRIFAGRPHTSSIYFERARRHVAQNRVPRSDGHFDDLCPADLLAVQGIGAPLRKLLHAVVDAQLRESHCVQHDPVTPARLQHHRMSASSFIHRLARFAKHKAPTASIFAERRIFLSTSFPRPKLSSGTCLPTRKLNRMPTNFRCPSFT